MVREHGKYMPTWNKAKRSSLEGESESGLREWLKAQACLSQRHCDPNHAPLRRAHIRARHSTKNKAEALSPLFRKTPLARDKDSTIKVPGQPSRSAATIDQEPRVDLGQRNLMTLGSVLTPRQTPRRAHDSTHVQDLINTHNSLRKAC